MITLGVAVVLLVAGPALAAVGPFVLMAAGAFVYWRWVNVAVITDDTGLSVRNILGFDRIARSEIRRFSMRVIAPRQTIVVAVLRDGPTCWLEATVRVNPFSSGRKRAEEQLESLQQWLRAEDGSQDP